MTRLTPRVRSLLATRVGSSGTRAATGEPKRPSDVTGWLILLSIVVLSVTAIGVALLVSRVPVEYHGGQAGIDPFTVLFATIWDTSAAPGPSRGPRGRVRVREQCRLGGLDQGTALGEVAGDGVALATVDQRRLLDRTDLLRLPATGTEPAA